ncbi:MAG TPA: hypothetical protein VHM26_14430 [Chitinophagaceae bacterium]|jgi:hypothetical protein|nr:hypothetical protein [Chitinophagaceae bacterium]
MNRNIFSNSRTWFFRAFILIAFSSLASWCTNTSSSERPVDDIVFNPKITLIAGSLTEYGSVTNTSGVNARFSGLTKLALDTRDGRTILYAIDQSDADLRIIEGDKVKTISNIVGVYALAQGLCLAPGGAGNIYITSGYGQLVQFDINKPFNDKTNPQVIIERNAANGTINGVGGTHGLATAPNGDIYLGNSYYNTITRYNFNTKTIVPFAGVPLVKMSDEIPAFTDGDALNKAIFGGVADIAINRDGKIYVADKNYRTIREIDNGKVKALFPPSPYSYPNYVQPSVDGSLVKVKSGMIHYIAIPANDNNRIFFATSGALRVILLDAKKVITIAKFKEGIHGLAVSADGKTIYAARGYGIVKIELDK